MPRIYSLTCPVKCTRKNKLNNFKLFSMDKYYRDSKLGLWTSEKEKILLEKWAKDFAKVEAEIMWGLKESFEYELFEYRPFKYEFSLDECMKIVNKPWFNFGDTTLFYDIIYCNPNDFNSLWNPEKGNRIYQKLDKPL